MLILVVHGHMTTSKVLVICCLETQFMAFISVQYCSPNTTSQFLWASGAHSQLQWLNQQIFSVQFIVCTLVVRNSKIYLCQILWQIKQWKVMFTQPPVLLYQNIYQWLTYSNVVTGGHSYVGFKTTGDVFQGQLKEKNGKWRLFKRWKKRYFTLSGGNFTYQKTGVRNSYIEIEVRN